LVAWQEVIEMVNGIVETSNLLQLVDDRLVATMEAAELCGLVAAGM
jgi:hypothetical protein